MIIDASGLVCPLLTLYDARFRTLARIRNNESVFRLTAPVARRVISGRAASRGRGNCYDDR